jgi:hypothetical protein
MAGVGGSSLFGLHCLVGWRDSGNGAFVDIRTVRIGGVGERSVTGL